jgi:hypothetical protein
MLCCDLVRGYIFVVSIFMSLGKSIDITELVIKLTLVNSEGVLTPYGVSALYYGIGDLMRHIESTMYSSSNLSKDLVISPNKKGCKIYVFSNLSKRLELLANLELYDTNNFLVSWYIKKFKLNSK